MNPKNIALLIKRYWLRDGKKAIVAIIGLWMIAMLMPFIFGINEPKDTALYNVFTLITLMFGTGILGSLMFSESSEVSKGYQWNILPVNNLEKLIAAWLLSFVAFVLLITLLYPLGHFILKGIEQMGVPFRDNTFEWFVSEQIQLALTINAISLMCAAWFKKLPLIKAIVVGNIGAFIFAGTALLLIKLTKPVYSMTQQTSEGAIWVVSNHSSLSFNNSIWSVLIVTAFAFYLLSVAYFKLKERRF